MTGQRRSEEIRPPAQGIGVQLRDAALRFLIALYDLSARETPPFSTRSAKFVFPSLCAQ